jgi:hypothetical protein
MNLDEETIKTKVVDLETCTFVVKTFFYLNSFRAKYSLQYQLQPASKTILEEILF